MQLMQCPHPADSVWGGMYRSAFSNNIYFNTMGTPLAFYEMCAGILWHWNGAFGGLGWIL